MTSPPTATGPTPTGPTPTGPSATGPSATDASTTGASPTGDGFNHLIHAPARLRICAALDHAREIEFAALTSLLGLSKSALSKHLSALAEAGYLAERRATRDTRQRLWLSLTPTGRGAYHQHVAALQHIVGSTHGPHPTAPHSTASHPTAPEPTAPGPAAPRSTAPHRTPPTA